MEGKQTSGRMYQGNDPGLDWECMEILEEGGTEWYLYRREGASDDWQSMKLVAQGKALRKANYWFGWNGKRTNNSRDWMTLGGHRAELQQAVLGYLKQT
jgi:hypothetical protein